MQPPPPLPCPLPLHDALPISSGLKSTKITGPARVFDSEEAAMTAIMSDQIEAGDVLVIRYEGPRGGPGMREMLSPTGALDRKSTRLNSSHVTSSYAVFCLKNI